MAGSIGLKQAFTKQNPYSRTDMKMEVVSPKEFMGDVIGDISSRRAHIELIETAVIWYYLSPYPLSESFDIPLRCGLRPRAERASR